MRDHRQPERRTPPRRYLRHADWRRRDQPTADRTGDAPATEADLTEPDRAGTARGSAHRPVDGPANGGKLDVETVENHRSDAETSDPRSV
jgi:hypothetical protein